MSQIQILIAQNVVAQNTAGEVTELNNKEVYMKVVGAYKNGNYKVKIFDNGTKIRETEDDEFIPNRLESVDMKITNKCDIGCPFCHEKSTPDGEHADLNNPVIDTFLPYTEIAIGGGNPLCHPQLEDFLRHLKELKCFPSMTVNQKHFIEEYDRIIQLYNEKLFYGLGISITNLTKDFADKVSQIPGAVIHVIAGLTNLESLKQMKEFGIKKVLILGYKVFGRGEDFYNQTIQDNINNLRDNMQEIKTLFEVLSFDNLAIEQLNVKSLMSDEEWAEFYMGDDGGYTMYIDMVNCNYGQSSTSTQRFELLSTINDMFLDIRAKKLENVKLGD